MKILICIMVLLSGCVATVDALDLDIETREGCCIKLGENAVRNCIADFVEPGHCSVWNCPTTNGAVCRLHDGTVVVPAGDFCEMTPGVPPEWCEE